MLGTVRSFPSRTTPMPRLPKEKRSSLPSALAPCGDRFLCFRRCKIAGLIVAGLILALVCRVAERLYIWHCKIARIPGMDRRVRMVLHRKDYSSSCGIPFDGLETDLGFAKFSGGFGCEFSSLPSNEVGIAFTCQSHEARLVFLPPFFDPDGNGVEMEIGVESAQPPKLGELLWMGRQDYVSLMERLLCKATTTRGHAEIYSYESSQTTGIVWIGDNEQDWQNASGVVSSTDGRHIVGFHLLGSSNSSNSITNCLDDVLSSFHFNNSWN